MKRKLNDHDVPEEVTSPPTDHPQQPSGFAKFGLDPRLLQAVTAQKFSTPTQVQARAIPLALSGKDILGMTLF